MPDHLNDKERRSRQRCSDRWGISILMLVTVVIVWTQVDRYLDPVGEKTVFVMQPGAADFVAPFEAARALLMQVNPYWNDIPELKDPFTDVRGAFVATDRKSVV